MFRARYQNKQQLLTANYRLPRTIALRERKKKIELKVIGREREAVVRLRTGIALLICHQYTTDKTNTVQTGEGKTQVRYWQLKLRGLVKCTKLISANGDSVKLRPTRNKVSAGSKDLRR